MNDESKTQTEKSVAAYRLKQRNQRRADPLLALGMNRAARRKARAVARGMKASEKAPEAEATS